MSVPKRVLEQQGYFSLVDGIPFRLPVQCSDTPVFMAVFPVNTEGAAALLPRGIHPLRFGNHGLLVVTVVNYQNTTIGKYVEYSIAIACTQGDEPAPPLLPGLLMKAFDTGQYVLDLPVSSEISVKGGKGIWGMPKHQANLDFRIGERTISSQYDLDGQLAFYAEINHPGKPWFPVNMGAVNYCSFRGMLMKSSVYFQGKAAFAVGEKASARVVIGDHPRVQPLRQLEIGSKAIATAFIPDATGWLDDHFECWFLQEEKIPDHAPEGMESVVNLGLSESWLPPPSAPIPGIEREPG